METVSMVHHLIAPCITLKLSAREIQELIMTKRTRKQPMMLEVHTMFEPHREAHHVLHQAYTLLFPLVRRRRLTPANTEAISSETLDQVGERKRS
jgi:hypothetical protein